MSRDRPYPDSWIHRQPGGELDPTRSTDPSTIAHDGERVRLRSLDALIAEHAGDGDREKRKDRFLPYLLVRSYAGDHGDRSFSGVFWESPDIWVAAGAPADTPAVPSSAGGTVQAGQPNTVYAHVWNLGLAPVAGVIIEFYWFNPSLVIDDAHGHLIGTARVNLGPRSAATSHQLVKCEKPWIPVMENGGHECLIVRVRSVGDPIGSNPYSPSLNRHVAQRNMTVVSTGADIGALLGSLEATRGEATQFRLLQIGAASGIEVGLASPRAKLDPALRTAVLAQLGRDGQLTQPKLSPDDPLAHNPTRRKIIQPGPPISVHIPHLPLPGLPLRPTGMVDLRHLFHPLAPSRTPGTNKHTIQDLFMVKPTGGLILRPPATGLVQALRIGAFNGQNQLLGGYTLIVEGR